MKKEKFTLNEDLEEAYPTTDEDYIEDELNKENIQFDYIEQNGLFGYKFNSFEDMKKAEEIICNIVGDKYESNKEDFIYLTKDLEEAKDSVYDKLNDYLEYEGIIGYTQSILDVYEDKEALIDGKLEKFDDSWDALNAYLNWEGIYGYLPDIVDIIEGNDYILDEKLELSEKGLPDAELEEPIVVSTEVEDEVLPEEPSEEVIQNAQAGMLSDLMKGHFDLLDAYRSVIATLSTEEDKEQVVEILNVAMDEESIILGMLTKASELINGKPSELMQQGEDKAEEILAEKEHPVDESLQEKQESYYCIYINNHPCQIYDTKEEAEEVVDDLKAESNEKCKIVKISASEKEYIENDITSYNESLKEAKESEKFIETYKKYDIYLHPGYNLWVNMKDYYTVYAPQGYLVGGIDTLEHAKELVDERVLYNKDI